MHWYERAQPTTGKLRSAVEKTAEEISCIDGVGDVRIWGSFAENLRKTNAPVREVDFLVFSEFNSGDLLAIDKGPMGPFRIKPRDLEDEGFNPTAVAFTKKLIKSACDFRAEYWAVSTDDVLLHWGPVSDTVEEWKQLRVEADAAAEKATGIAKAALYKSEPDKIRAWFENYERTLKDAVASGPLGWYASSSDLEEIASKAVSL